MKYKKFIHVFPFSLLRCSCFWQLRYKWLFLVVVCLFVSCRMDQISDPIEIKSPASKSTVSPKDFIDKFYKPYTGRKENL